jgi:hypothetical protein
MSTSLLLGMVAVLATSVLGIVVVVELLLTDRDSDGDKESDRD